MSTKNNLKAKEELSRDQEYQKLFAKAVKAYNKREYKESYCSFQSVAYRYKIERTKLAYDAKYFLGIHLMTGLGVSKNPKEARNLFKEVSTSDSKYKEATREQLNNLSLI
ncbi:924_t:CDS:1 [Gigaspora margarita]|uniref:924_t:CDS:1 n=1 Tax=Gigaspora margarita TaxID=4874 RepID=A0ABN7X693_GIGMA|nr:924_t:CDS:1 [Gigaspora margarita]